MTEEKEIIKSIHPVDNYRFHKSLDGWDGYKVITTKQEMFVLVSNGSNCCENWGYLSSFENPELFIGGELLKIEVVDTALNTKKWKEYSSLDGGGAMFVNFETNKGLFQLTVYNAHNGYYGHNAVLISNQLKEERTL